MKKVLKEDRKGNKCSCTIMKKNDPQGPGKNGITEAIKLGRRLTGWLFLFLTDNKWNSIVAL